MLNINRQQLLVIFGSAIIGTLIAVGGLYLYRAGKIDLAQGGVSDWPVYGQNEGGARYSTVDQVNRENVSQLEIAWEYHTGDMSDGSDDRQKTTFQTTPILLDGTMYLSTAHGWVIALDPETGKERWKFDPQVDLNVFRSELANRGVTAWLDPAKQSGSVCMRRIFVGTIDARLIALDAATGAPCSDFGQDGQVDLSKGVDLLDYQVDRRQYSVTSPPVIIKDLVVVGSAIGDNRAVTLERGIVRAFDARTGKMAWVWDPVPRQADDPASATWEGESAQRTGAGNVWAQLSVDAGRDLVFIPTTSPSPDYFGGERLGSNLYANSVVALRGSTGQVVWHYQVVHHDLWDYDVPAQPVLIDVVTGGRKFPAVVQATKMGFLFVLHRETGEPLFPVEERAVPQSKIPGEKSWPTQPFPTKPAPLARMKVGPDDAWGISYWDRQQCRQLIERHRNEGIFTPPGFEGSIQFPGIAGGGNWGSLAHDPQRGLVVLNMIHLPFIVTLIPREKGPDGDKEAEFARMHGTPYLMKRKPMLSSLGLPCVKPPWGTIAAVDLETGDLKWEVPLGTIRDLSPVPLPLEFGSPNLGGPIVTAGGLVFIGAAAENAMRAFDVETGKELWHHRLPASAQAIPMTYRLKRDGRQFVVMAAGGHGKLGTKIGDSVIAFALPQTGTRVLMAALKDTIPYLIAALLILFLLMLGRNVLLNRWLWISALAILIIGSTEYRWLMTQSLAAMAVWFVLGLAIGFVLMRLRKIMANRMVRI